MPEKQRPTGTDAEVLALLRQTPPGKAPSIVGAARGLGISPRTLQRHLAVRGLTFRALVDEARSQEALDLLLNTNLTIAEISARLGYSTPSGFCRAFSRWTGRSPGALRGAAPVRPGTRK